MGSTVKENKLDIKGFFFLKYFLKSYFLTWSLIISNWCIFI